MENHPENTIQKQSRRLKHFLMHLIHKTCETFLDRDFDSIFHGTGITVAERGVKLTDSRRLQSLQRDYQILLNLVI